MPIGHSTWRVFLFCLLLFRLFWRLLFAAFHFRPWGVFVLQLIFIFIYFICHFCAYVCLQLNIQTTINFPVGLSTCDILCSFGRYHSLYRARLAFRHLDYSTKHPQNNQKLSIYHAIQKAFGICTDCQMLRHASRLKNGSDVLRFAFQNTPFFFFAFCDGTHDHNSFRLISDSEC